jgi:hypothetical protein
MRCDGSALRRRMRAMEMIDLRADHVVDGIQTYCETRSQTCRRQTRVSRTGTRLPARHLERDGRGALMFCRCFMFQMFQSPPRPRA